MRKRLSKGRRLFFYSTITNNVKTYKVSSITYMFAANNKIHKEHKYNKEIYSG